MADGPDRAMVDRVNRTLSEVERAYVVNEGHRTFARQTRLSGGRNPARPTKRAGSKPNAAKKKAKARAKRKATGR